MANVAAPDGFEWIDDGPPAPAAVTPDFSGAPMPPPRPPELNQPPVARQEFNPPRPADVPLPPPRPAELGKSTASKDDDDDDLGRPKPPDGFEWVQDQPTLFDVIAESARKGLHRGLEDTWEGAKVVGRGSFKGTEPGPGMDFSPVGQLLQTKLADGWKDPQWWAAQITHGLAASSPTLAAGALGGAAGASVAGPPGALVGGVGGFALGSALQTIAPAYQRARAEGLDHDAAVDRAMLETGIAGAFGAAMGAAPAAPVFGKTATGALKAPISEALAQIFGVQPGLMAAHKATENVVEGKPVGEGVPEAAIIGAATGPFMVAGHAALRAGKRAVMGEAPAAAQSADPVGDFIRDADEASARAEARAAGRKTKEEIDEFIRQKDAADAAREAAKRAAAEPSPAEPVEPAQQQRQPADRQAAGPDADNAVRQRRPADAPGRPVSPAAEPGADRGPAPNPAVEAENKALRAAGWSDDEIALLSPKERTAELRDAGYEAETAASRQDPVAEAGAGQPARAENADAAVRAAAPKPQQTEVIEPRQAWDRLQSIYDGVEPMLENPATATPEAIAKARADLAALRNRFGDADSAEHKALREGIDRVADHITTAEIDAKAGTRAAPIKVAEPKDVEPARARVEPEPSEGQKAAGNYRKGHIEYDGLPVSIENPKGSVRRGVDPDGKPWSVEMPGDYGYIKGTKGADKDHVDILIGDKAPNGTAYVIDQQDPRTGKFDEHKVVVGVDSVGDAARLYHKSFSDGSGIERVGAINKVPISHLQDWLAQGRRTKPMAPAEPLPAAAPVSHEIAPVPTPPSKKRRNSSGAPVTLLGWLRSNGGIQDQGGELRSRDLAKRYIGLVNSRGMTLDDARLRAAEAGYFGPMKDERMADTTVNDLLEKLDQHPTYSSDDQEALDRIADKAAQKRAEKRHEKDIARARHQIEREMQAHDLQPDTEAIDLAARIMVEEEQAWDEAFERATMRLAHETPETKAALDATATEDGYDAIPWDDYLEGQEAQEAAAGATGGRDQAAGGSRQEGDRRGEEGADHGRSEKPARAGADEQDRAPRDEGQRGEPGEVEATARAEVQAGDADETVTVSLTPKGPWDFNDTFPAPDADKMAALEREGRYVIGEEGDPDAMQIASIFDEAIETELMPAWRAIREGHKALPGIMRGEGKPPKGIKKHDEWARQVRNRISEARQDIENTKAALEEYFTDDAATAAVREARRRELGTVRAQGPAPVEKPAAAPERTPVEALTDRFLRMAAREEPGFDTIVEARKFLRDAGWEAKPERGPENKQIEEAIEHALVEAAREIAQHTKLRPSEIFGKLVVLYEAQPRLNARSSKSVAEQAYSTPAPLAYVASRLAGIDATKTVLEPSAGNGMLLIEADPKKVTANEIDATRAEALRAQGFGRVTEEDATRPGALPKGADVVIANPPFGAVREGGESKTFRVGEFATTNIDFAIALNALQAMKPDGRAVLIVGGVKAESQAERAKGYQAASKRKFYYRLLRDYNVADVFTVAGDLYARQGAGWPVDVIVIDGKGPSSRKPLSAEPPPLLQSWGEVKEKLNVPQTPGPERETPGASGLRGEEAGSSDPASPAGEQALAQGRSREPVAGGRPLEPRAATRQPRGVGDKPAVGQPEGMGRGAVGDGAQPAPRPVPDGSRADYLPDPDRGWPVAANAAGQAPYRPASTKAAGLGTLIPANLAVPAADSLDRIQRAHGQIDHFVAAALAYPMDDAGPYFVAANGEKVRPFSAEQIDAAALAIDNVERGSGFIVGDQTGIGKGRVVAAAIRYAHRKGMLPVFVTEKPDLYGDMWRDLHDIGWDRHLGRPIEMFMTNSGVRVPLDERAVQWVAEAQVAADAGEKAPPREGAFSTSQSNDVAARQMHEIIAGTSKPDVVFTTYDQMNSVAGEETERRSFLRQVAPKAFLIMDEAHNAGGQGLQQRGKKDAAPPRSKVFREAVARARAVVYSSATYAKSPQVMDLFSRTDMLKAVDDPEKLGELIAKGGVPMQQIVSAMLAKSGQYLRRERSFEGVSYEVETAPVDQQSYETFTEGLSTIFRFDKFFSDERKDLAAKYAAELGAGNAQDGGVGERGANTTEFSSIMHNAISQMVLSIKAKAAAARAIKALQAGERPVIALSATMESFIKDFTEAAGIREGDPINLDFGDVLRRYLERTRRVTIKMPDDTKKHVMIPDADMAGVTRQMFEEAKATLAGIDMADLPISPIDAIRHEIQKAGYSVREVTGRDTMIDYGGAEPTLVARPAGERGAAGKRVTIRMFNSGDVDAVILNRSGSTGVSMHAGEKFKNQQPRRMILVQADPNIDVHMQMLGRVHRTGQVALPAYSQLAADIPAEVRPTAVLMKKMASLNANTTAARKSKFTGDAVDFMNKYGDIVAAQAMLDDPRTNARLGYPVRMDEDGQGVVAGSMAKVTGRLTLLKPAEQQKLLDTLTENYTALIERLDAEGANDLEAKSLDLQAKVLDGAIIRAASGDSPFQDAVRLEQVSIKAQGRAMAPAEVLGAVLETLDIKHPDGGTFARTLPVLKAEAHQRQRATISRVTEEAKTYADREIKATLKNPDAIAKARKKADDTIARWQSVAAIAYPGNIVTVEFQGAQLPAVVLDFFSKTTEGQNPVALSKWHMTVAVPDSARTIGAPLSQVWTPQFPKPDGKAGVPLAPASYMDTPASIEGLFEKARKEGRENRWMFAGNILAAYDQANGQGQIVNHTMEDGSSRPAILMPKAFKKVDFMASRPIRFTDARHVLAFLDKLPDGEVASTDGAITIRRTRGSYEFDLPAARATGGRYYADGVVRAVYDAWEKKGSRMRADLAPDKAREVVAAMQKVGAVFEVRDHQDIAEKIIAADKPKPLAQVAPKGWDSVEGLMDRHGAELARMVNQVADIFDTVLPREVGYEITRNIRTPDRTTIERSGGDVRAPYITGMYSSGAEKMVRVSTFSPDAAETAYHEAWHAAQDLGLANARELKVLRAPAELARMRAFVAKSKGQRTADNMPPIEIEAYAFGVYASALYEGRPPPRFHAITNGVFARLYDLVRRLRNFFSGRNFQTVEDVIRRFQRGDMTNRPAAERTESRLHGDEIMSSRERAEAAAATGNGDSSFAQTAEPPPEPDPTSRYFADRTLRQRIGDRIDRLPDRVAVNEAFLDMHARVAKTQDEIAGGAAIPANLDTYKAKRRLPGQIAAQEQDFRHDFVEPLLTEAKAAGLTRQDMAEWLFAKHAPERNAAMDAIDPRNEGRGSGITDAEAAAIIERLTRDGKSGALANVESRVAAIRDFALDRAVETGLMSQEHADAISASYEHYVPLQGWDDPTQAHPDAMEQRPGGGMRVKGSEFRKAFGRRTVSGDPLATLINNAMRTIDRAEKNKALRVAWRFLKSIPADELSGVRLDKGRMVKTIDPETGMVAYREEAAWQHRDNVVPLKIGGVPHYIVFDDPVIAKAWMRMSAEQLHWTVGWAGSVVNTAKSAWTHWNPEFVVRHFGLRYPIEGALNAAEHGGKAALGSFKSYPMGPAFRAIRAYHGLDAAARADLARKASEPGASAHDRYLAAYDEMRQNGGLMAWSDFGGVDRIKKRIDHALLTMDRNPVRASIGYLRGVHEAIDHVTSAMDNAQRLVAYMQARERGSNRIDAAMTAREATVDFALKGTMANYLTLMWPFANTAGQTASRMVRAARRNPREMLGKVIGGMFSLGMAAALYAYLYGGNDEDGVPFFEKTGDWTRRLHIVLPIPGVKDDKKRPYMLQVSLPYNYAMPFVAGQTVIALMMRAEGRSKQPVGKILGNLGHSVLEGTTPLAQEHSLVGKMTPELMRPFLHVAMNQNWHGAPVHPSDEPWNKGIPASEKGFRSTAEMWKRLARVAHQTTGLDYHPEDYREVMSYFTSTLQGVASRAGDAASDVRSGRKPDPTDVPVAHAFIGGGKQYDSADRRAYYEARDKAFAAETRFKDLKKAAQIDPSKAELVQDFYEKHQADIRAARLFRSGTGTLSDLTKQMNRIQQNKDMTPTEQETELRALRERQLSTMNRLRERVRAGGE